MRKRIKKKKKLEIELNKLQQSHDFLKEGCEIQSKLFVNLTEAKQDKIYELANLDDEEIIKRRVLAQLDDEILSKRGELQLINMALENGKLKYFDRFKKRWTS